MLKKGSEKMKKLFKFVLFGISNVSDDIVVNFTNRDVVSLKGIEKDGVTHYSEYTL